MPQLSLLDWRQARTEPSDPIAPTIYATCMSLGLGTECGCPWYRCRNHLGINVRTDGTLQILIEPDDLDKRETCSIAVANRGEHGPWDVAAILKISNGLVELEQRHAWAKSRAALGRVHDESRGVDMDVDGIPDYR